MDVEWFKLVEQYGLHRCHLLLLRARHRWSSWVPSILNRELRTHCWHLSIVAEEDA